MTRKAIVAKVLQRIRVAARYAMEFPSETSYKDYMHEHPGADPRNHTVKKPVERLKVETPKSFFSKEEQDLPKVIKQPVDNVDALYKSAHEAHETQLNWLNHGKGLDKAIGATVIRKDKGEEIDLSKPGPVIVIGSLKKKERVEEKVKADYDGDFSRIGDIVRSSVAVDSKDQLDEVMGELRKTGLKLARKPTDRFANPTDTGYRDLLMNVTYPNGHVGELQLHLKSMLKAKDEGHHYYNQVRKIAADAKAEGRTTLTEEESKTVEEANGKAKVLYDKAWNDAAQKIEKTAMNKSAKSGIKYYEYDGKPAYYQRGKFPMQLIKGKARPIYDLEAFFREATPLSERDYIDFKKE